MPFVQIKEEETETCSYSFCKYVIVSTYRLGAFRMDSTTMTPPVPRALFFVVVVFVVVFNFFIILIMHAPAAAQHEALLLFLL